MRLEHWLYTVPLRSLFRRAQPDQELDDELRDHLEPKNGEIHMLTSGVVPEEARREALLDIGGIEKSKEECRDAGPLGARALDRLKNRYIAPDRQIWTQQSRLWQYSRLEITSAVGR